MTANSLLQFYFNGSFIICWFVSFFVGDASVKVNLEGFSLD